jgi:hypothetical protein
VEDVVMRVDAHAGRPGPGALDSHKDGATETAQVLTPGLRLSPAGSDDAVGDGVTTDTVEISAEAQALLAGGSMPDQNQSVEVRPEMVDRARKILESGAYNDQGVLEKTAEKIAAVLSAEA